MTDVWVVNASPIIVLAKASRLQLISGSCREVIIPEAVATEILAGPVPDPARQAIQQGWGRTVACLSAPASVLEWGLGAGETSVLALALERKLTAVLDDYMARVCARTLGIEVIGTLGVILRAKKKSIIPCAADVLKAVRAAGLHFVRVALQGVGEVWE